MKHLPEIDTCNWCGQEKKVEWVSARTEREFAPVCEDCVEKLKEENATR